MFDVSGILPALARRATLLEFGCHLQSFGASSLRPRFALLRSLAAASLANAQQHRRGPSRVPNTVRLSLPGTMPKRFIARCVTRQLCACRSGVIPAASFS